MSTKYESRRPAGRWLSGGPNVPLLKRTSEQEQYSVASALAAPLQDNRPKNRSKKIPQRIRPSAFKDKKTLKK
ncbi:hypothetical protein ACVW1A_005969 [Bradyrhizobium sp. LB1.3]